MHYLYKITNTLNNNIYIGQTISVEMRWAAHKSYAKKPERSGQYIHRAMLKYGINNFSYENIATCRTQEDANEIESILISQYNSLNKEFGYNIKPGGNTSPHSDETKQKLREATLKQIETNGHPAQGTKRTIDQKENMSYVQQNNRNNNYTPEIRKRMSDSHIGIKQTAETIKKRGDAVRARTGDMKCNAPGCEIMDRRHSIIINDIRYCSKHAARLNSTGTLNLLPRKAHNKKQFNDDQINKILLDKRAAATIGKDFGVSERIILRIRKDYKNIIINTINVV